MSNQIRKFKDIVLEHHMVDGDQVSKLEANYTDHGHGDERCRSCQHYEIPNACAIVEGFISPLGWCKYFEQYSLDEKWGVATAVSPNERGKYHGKSKQELLHAYHALKKSGPHHQGSPEYSRMRELAFAIRAKGGWGSVSEKMANKDYDRDGRIESEKDEVWGSRLRAAARRLHAAKNIKRP